jgi:hypothetical protein
MDPILKIARYVCDGYLRKISSKKEIITGGTRNNYANEVYDIISLTYKSIGVPVSRPEDLLKYDVWEMSMDKDGSILAVSLWKKTSYGHKAGLSGHNGSSAGKSLAVKGIREKFKRDGYYGEVSHKVKDIALAAGAPTVPVEYVSDILNKTITPTKDNHYKRSISGVGTVEKVMVGKPRYRPLRTADVYGRCTLRISSSETLLYPCTSAHLYDEEVIDRHAHMACLIS